jgi:predicted nucleotidyltransferase
MLQIDLPLEEIAALCRKWKVTELAVFGSVLRGDFGPHSDVDFLVSFADDADWDYFDFFDFKRELAVLVQREIDLIPLAAARPSNRIDKLAEHAETVYAAS